MPKALIRLVYRKVIDAASAAAWNRVVFEETHREFYMQVQRLDPAGQYPTLRELLANVPGAERLHGLVSRVAVPYLQQLNQRIPDLTNALGQAEVPFTNFKFELLASHVEQKEVHRVAIQLFSDPLTWIDTLSDHLLLATGDQRAALRAGQEVETVLLALQPNLSIAFFQPEALN
jgi:hypothetical protein